MLGGGAQTEVCTTGADSGQATGSPLTATLRPGLTQLGEIQGLPPTELRRRRVGASGVLWGGSPASGSSQVSPHSWVCFLRKALGQVLPARARGPLPHVPHRGLCLRRQVSRADTYITTSRDMLNIVLGTTLGLNMAVVQFFGDYLDLEC